MLVRFKVLVLDFYFFEQCFNDFCSMNSVVSIILKGISHPKMVIVFIY